MTTDELIDIVRRYAAEHLPLKAVVLTLSSPKPNGVGPYLSVLVKVAPAAGVADAGRPKIGPTQRRILRAVADMDAEAPTGEDIAAAAKFPYESHLKKLLSTMRKDGLLGGQKNEQGYPITPAGLDALGDLGD